MQKRRRTIALADERPYREHRFVFVNTDTGEICECEDIVPLLKFVAIAVDVGHEWNLMSLYDEQAKGEGK